MTSDPLTERDCQQLLEGAELSACLEGALRDLKELRLVCLQAGIPAAIGSDEGSCGGGKCTPKAQLLVRPGDAPRVGELLRNRWESAVRELGVEPSFPVGEQAAEGELPCPACGTPGPLVEGACSDCGLQLE